MGNREITVFLNGKPIHFPAGATRQALFQAVPEYLKNSTAPLPKPQPGEESIIPNEAVDLLRSAIKSMVRPFMPKLLRRMYGPATNVPHGKQDVMPFLVGAMIDFALTQASKRPIEITYAEADGLVLGVRQRLRDGQADHPRPETGAARSHATD